MHYLFMCRCSEAERSLWKDIGKLKIIGDYFISSLSFKDLRLCNLPSASLLAGWKDHPPNLYLVLWSPSITPLALRAHGKKPKQTRKTPKKAKICSCRFPAMLYFILFFFNNEEPFVSCVSFLGLCLSNVLNYIKTTASFLSLK